MSDGQIRAAQYVRMSTEHQQYSTENQADILRDYASKRGIQIVRTFCDAGKSGLRLEGREGLRALLDTVQRGAADFSMILVYDVSRWGRFQGYLPSRAKARASPKLKNLLRPGLEDGTKIFGEGRAYVSRITRASS